MRPDVLEQRRLVVDPHFCLVPLAKVLQKQDRSNRMQIAAEGAHEYSKHDLFSKKQTRYRR